MRPVAAWEQVTTRVLDAIHLRSIQGKILVFALFATLIPSLTMGWLSYRNNRQVIDAKVSNELDSLTTQAARDIELAVEELRYEVRVYSNSYEVLENLGALRRPDVDPADRAAALERARRYLDSVTEKLTDYEELTLLDAGGVGASPVDATSGLPEDWLYRTGEGEPVATPHGVDGTFVVKEPVRSAEGEILGVLAARVRLDKIRRILEGHLTAAGQELYVVSEDGLILAASADLPDPAARFAGPVARRLFEDEGVVTEYVDLHGNEVVGSLDRISVLGWAVVAQKERARAYAPIVRLRNETLALIAAVSLGIGVAAYLLCLTIVPPLERLARGAGEVAGGNLDVTLPVHGSSEVSHVTRVFNGMVERLRGFRDADERIRDELQVRNEELEIRSITDGLTGLYNRAYLSQILIKELARSVRHEHPFAVIMIDIDRFKRLNDTKGHQTGDAVLVRVGEILRDAVRAADYVARYGGEEFLVVVTETGPEGALHLAEKIRRKFETMEPVAGNTITVSAGVAAYPAHGDTIETIVGEADRALYRAKDRGRNRVMPAGDADVETIRSAAG